MNLSESLNLDKTVNFGVYAERSKNYTGADIQSILTSANMIAVKECIEKDTEVSSLINFIKQKKKTPRRKFLLKF